MERVPKDATAAVKRARWLAELAAALEEAHQVVKRVGSVEGGIEAVDLYSRIETVRLEVEALQSRRSAIRDQDFDPQWTNLPLWHPEKGRSA